MVVNLGAGLPTMVAAFAPAGVVFRRSTASSLASISVELEGFVLGEIAPGVSAADVIAANAAPLRVSAHVPVMQL